MTTVEATDLIVRTANVELLDQTVQQLGPAVVVEGSYNGDTCRVRVFGPPGFLRFAITQQGYGEILGEGAGMTDRWTAEIAELVARALAEHRATLLGLGDLAAAWSCSCGADGYGVRRFAIAEGERHQGVSILIALADAGLLQPPGGETRIERGKYVPGTGGVSPCTNRCRQEQDHTHDRERTVHVGPWVPVNDGGGT